MTTQTQAMAYLPVRGLRVYHSAADGMVAACDPRVSLDASTRMPEPVVTVRLCKRCARV